MKTSVMRFNQTGGASPLPSSNQLHAISIGAEARVRNMPWLREKLTRHTRFGDTITMYREDGEHLWIPREFVSSWDEDLRSEGHPCTFNLLLGTKNKQQEEIYDRSLRLLKGGKSHVLQAGTGTGKSALALMLAAALGRTTLVVVNKDTMVHQWKLEIVKFLGIPYDEIGHIQQDRCDVAGRKIVVGMLHSLARDKYPEWIKDYFGFFIGDEIHNYAAPTFSVVASMFSARLRLGLSATPKRSDGAEFLFHAHIGPVGVVSDSTLLSPKVIAIKSEFTLPLRKVKRGDTWVFEKIPLVAGRTGHVLKMIARDMSRNRRIVNFVKQAYDRGRYIVVFSDLVTDHILPLRGWLEESGVSPEDIGVFSSTATKKTLLEGEKKKRVVLTTYKMCAEAIDMPRWDTAVLATPRSSIKQSVGRVLREHEDKSSPVVLDVVDAEVPLFLRYFSARCKQYNSVGATIVYK